ncbi:hypothetical protein BDW68DRAFT_178750 [Aspergillus falconensis]
MDEADPETNISDVPPSLAELDLPNITETLFNGEPYWGAYKELKSVAFPAPAQELKRVLQAQIPDDYSENVVNCMIQWEVLELMDSGEIMKTDLDSVLALTGTFDHTSVCRPGDYIYQQWGSGRAVLGALKELLAPFLKGSPEAQSKWVTRALTPDHEFRLQMLTPGEGMEQALLQIKWTLDSGEAAFRVIEQKQDMSIPLKIGENRKYCDIIHDFMHIWEQRKSQTSARQSELNFRFSTSIRGWDFVDMQNKQDEFLEREISTSASPDKALPSGGMSSENSHAWSYLGGMLTVKSAKSRMTLSSPIAMPGWISLQENTCFWRSYLVSLN